MEQLLGEIDDGKGCLKAIQSSRVFCNFTDFTHNFLTWIVLFL